MQRDLHDSLVNVVGKAGERQAFRASSTDVSETARPGIVSLVDGSW